MNIYDVRFGCFFGGFAACQDCMRCGPIHGPLMAIGWREALNPHRCSHKLEHFGTTFNTTVYLHFPRLAMQCNATGVSNFQTQPFHIFIFNPLNIPTYHHFTSFYRHYIPIFNGQFFYYVKFIRFHVTILLIKRGAKPVFRRWLVA